MLRELRIQNLVLIESGTIPFSPGFNVISGETGSGKSALMESLRLISGEKADPALIRRGAEKGSVEALFEIDLLPQVKALLEEAGIDHEMGEPLILRRDIALAGKGRALINNQAVQLALLRMLTPLLFDQVGQHANRSLLTVEEHRTLLDHSGGIVNDLADSWEEENRLKDKLKLLIDSSTEREREIENSRREIEEISEAQLKDGEEEALFAEYSRLAHADELAAHLNSLDQMLTHERQGVLPLLNRHRNTLEKITQIDAQFNEMTASYQNVLAELQEVAYIIQNGLSRSESQPERTHEINERLALLNRLKRKFGATVAEVQAYLAKIEARLAQLEHMDETIETLRTQIETLKQKNDKLAQKLSDKRQKAAHALAKAVTPQLQALNMPKAEFEIRITPQTRSRTGDDRVEFFLKPNVGENLLPVKDFASGGELSRLMLALQTLLAGKRQLPTLIFDEVDANIGGTTAAIVGEKLGQIGRQHQVIAITHFPQVAQFAEHHLQIAKREVQGRTLTEIRPLLDEAMRTQELARMRGG